MGQRTKSVVGQTVKNLVKLTIAGGVIAGVGFSLIAQDATVEHIGPAEASADIADFMPTVTTDQQKFTAAVAGMGMRPRMFDVNGNTMFFASGSYEMKPMEFLEKSQAHFVKSGVNKENHAKTTPIRQQAAKTDWDGTNGDFKAEYTAWTTLLPAAQSMLDGDIVPTHVAHDRIEMVGYQTADVEDFDLAKMIEDDKSGRPVRNLIGGYRYLDAHWEPGTGRSAVTAVWSADDDFASERMVGEGDQSPPDPDVPACVGCTRDFRVQSLDKTEPYQSNMFLTTSTVTDTYEFYRSAMLNRGWTESGVQPHMNRLAEHLDSVAELNERGRVLSLERGNQAIQLAIMPGDRGKAQVVTLHETGGAQNELPELK